MKTTEDIAQDAIRFAYERHFSTKGWILDKYVQETLAAYLTRFDAPTAADKELEEQAAEKYPIREDDTDEVKMYYGAKRIGWMDAMRTAPAPQNAAGDNAFPLNDVLKYLIRGTEILLHKKNYDGPDYEEMNHCVKRAKEIITAPQNAAGDNWIREEAVLNFARYIENRVQHFHNWQIYEIKTLTEAYLKLPSPPTATAEQDKK